MYASELTNGGYPSDNVWDPNVYLQSDTLKELNYAIVVLNRPINFTPKLMIPLWNNACIRITVDGGTHRWLNYIRDENNSMFKSVPIDIVSGDFDSVSQETLSQAKSQGVLIIKTLDQNETDFTKSLRVLEQHCRLKNLDLDTILVIAQSSGRLDQIMGNLNTLYKHMRNQIFSNNIPMYLVSNDSLSWLLTPGKHKILIPDQLRASNAWCGLIPLGEKCDNVTTTGLKWNIKDGKLEFGVLVSSSNSFAGCDTVTVECSSPILWCMNISSLLNKVYGTTEEEDD